MKFKSYLSAGIVCVLFTFAAAQEALAKSVFAVSGHATGKIKAYLADPNGTIEFQATIPNPLANATGLCLWPEKDRMFVTYEGKATISWASIKNLDRNPDTDDYETGITGGNGLGGMVVSDDGVMYVLCRGTNRLYAFGYDEPENTLVPVPLGETTDYVALDNISYGMDIAFDAQGSTLMGVSVGRLYVSDYSSAKVRYYNTVNWDYEGYIEMKHPAVGIGLDTVRNYLYAGYFPGGGGQNYLMRYDLAGDPNDTETSLEKDMGFPVMDIAVDEDTGYIYLTTYHTYNQRTGTVEVYDPAQWNATNPDDFVLDIENDSDFGGSNNGPAGIAIGPTYKPTHNMYLAKVDDVEDPNECVVPDDIYHYTIAFRPGPAGEPNVVITDYLAEGVDFVSADPNTGTYYPRPDHMYVWELGDVSGYDPNDPSDPNQYFELTVQVNNYAEPGGTLYNKVTAESDWSYVDADESTPVCCWGGDVIYVDRNAPGPHIGTTWQTAYLDL
ncbi:DUF11 domain-containing protein, partial [Candidatus Pacearchaeota archaeon]|nr:DUF11 domain-containing protein [Candidatus Pacearchaeota archaeon]